MAIRLFWCAVLFGWMVPSAAAQEPKTASDFYNRGAEWIEKGDYDKAIKDFDEAIRLNPKLADAFIGRGAAFVEKGEFDKAIKDFGEAIRLNPKDAAAFYNRGQMWAGKRDFDKAIKDYDEAIRLNPKLVDAFYNRGSAWGNKGDFDKAIKDYDEVIRLKPKDADAFYVRGLAWKAKREGEKAAKDFAEAKRLQAPRTADARADDKPAAKPADARRAALVKAGYTPVPLRAEPRHLGLGVDCMLGTEKVKFTLDSGATPSSLDLKVARRLNLKLGAESATTGVDGMRLSRRTYVSNLKIGTYDTSKDMFQVGLQVENLSAQAGAPEGILGLQQLETWGTVLDYSSRTMYLRSPLVNAWPRLAGTWEVKSRVEDGAARKLDPKAPTTFTFADRRLKVIDEGKSEEFAIQYVASDMGDYLFFYQPTKGGELSMRNIESVALVKVKDGAMTICMMVDNGPIPTKLAAPKGSGLALMELKRTTPAAEKPADPIRKLLLKEGYAAVPMERETYGIRTVGARIGKNELRLMVDSGATWSAFDTAGLKKWGAMRLGGLQARGGRGKVNGDEINLRGLTLGGYDTRRAFGVVYGAGFDLSLLNEAMVAHKQRPVDGLLGSLDLLNGSAVIDFGTNTLYLRPVKQTLWPRLEGKWVGVRYEQNGKKGNYKPGDAAVEFKSGRIRFATPGKSAEWGFHVEDELDLYRIGLFDPKADEMADGFQFAVGGLLLRQSGDTLSIVFGEPTEFAAPAGSGLLLVEYERAIDAAKLVGKWKCLQKGVDPSVLELRKDGTLTITIMSKDVEVDMVGKYKIEGQKVIVNLGLRNQVYIMNKLTDRELVWTADDNVTESYTRVKEK